MKKPLPLIDTENFDQYCAAQKGSLRQLAQKNIWQASETFDGSDTAIVKPQQNRLFKTSQIPKRYFLH